MAVVTRRGGRESGEEGKVDALLAIVGPKTRRYGMTVAINAVLRLRMDEKLEKKEAGIIG
jgi:hypothetical protein